MLSYYVVNICAQLRVCLLNSKAPTRPLYFDDTTYIQFVLFSFWLRFLCQDDISRLYFVLEYVMPKPM